MNSKLKIIILVYIVFFRFELQAEEVYFDLSQDNIEIKTDFNGKEIVIFGLLKDDHETLLTIKGSPLKMKIQKKNRYLGVWINNKQITYSKVPTLFFSSSSSNIDDILPSSTLINEDLSFEKILKNKTFNQNFIFENNQDLWNKNFVRIKKNQLLFNQIVCTPITLKHAGQKFLIRKFFPSLRIFWRSRQTKEMRAEA